MKRYLYTLLGIIALCVACKPEPAPKQPDVAFYFSTVNVETTAETAIITAAEPYMTIDGIKYDKAVVYLEYLYYNELTAENPTPFRIYNYEVKDGNLIFTIENLTEATKYAAYTVVDGGEYGYKESDMIYFATEKLHNKELTVSYTWEVDAKGVMATINLSELAYLVDGESVDFDMIEVDYARKDSSQWISKQFFRGSIVDGTLSVEIPYNGKEYLEDNSDYKFRITLCPADNTYRAITSAENEFKTPYAEITADIDAPTLSREANMINATVENIEIYYDGIKDHNYEYSTTAEYFFYYRTKDTEMWSMVKTSGVHEKMSATIPAKEGNTYEVKVVIFAGKEEIRIESETSEITLAPSTPPVSGGDTSAVIGTWHLTEWRGAEPSFDIYLDITDGVVTLYQRLESRAWECFVSSAAIEEGIIKGTYVDGVAWGTSYYVTTGDDTMTWIDTTDSSDISVYTRATLPEGITPTTTRATTTERFL